MLLLLLVENANQKYGWGNCVPMYIILRFLHLVSGAVCALCLEKNISFPKDKLSSYLSGRIAKREGKLCQTLLGCWCLFFALYLPYLPIFTPCSDKHSKITNRNQGKEFHSRARQRIDEISVIFIISTHFS